MISNLRRLVARRRLVWELVLTDVRSQASETRLGLIWWLVDPVLMMLIYWVFIVLLFGRDKYTPYPIFVGCALISWKHLSTSLSKGSNVLRQYESVIKSVAFPTMVLPLALVLSQFAHFLGAFVVLTAAALLLGLPLTATFAQVPALMAFQILIVTGLTLVVASLGALFRDLQNLLSHLLRMAWYLSPGIYGLDLVDERFGGARVPVLDVSIGELVRLNPFAVLFTGYRGALHDPAWIAADLWLILAAESVLLLALGYRVYRYFDRRVIKFL